MKNLVFTFVLVLLMTDSQMLWAQDPLPFMCVKSGIGGDRVILFNGEGRHRDEIRGKSSDVSKQFETKSQLDNFWGLLRHIKREFSQTYFIRIYLATEKEGWPRRKMKKIKFIISPCDINNKDLGYFVLDKKFDSTKPEKSKIDSADVMEFVGNYKGIRPSKLLDCSDLDNFPDSNINKGCSDTKYVTFCFQDFLTLFEVVKSHDGNPSGDIICTLGSTPVGGIEEGSLRGRFRYRTTIQLSLLDINDKPIVVDKLPHFDTSKRAPSACPELNKFLPKSSDDIDNGLLCPYNCPIDVE